MDLDKVREIAEELLQCPELRTVLKPGSPYSKMVPDPVTTAIIVGSVYIAHLLADRLDGVGEDKESHEQDEKAEKHSDDEIESHLRHAFYDLLNFCRKQIKEAKNDSDSDVRRVRMDAVYRYLKIASEIGYDGLEEKQRYEDIKGNFWRWAKVYDFIYDRDCLT